jgi:hypothetical protein
VCHSGPRPRCPAPGATITPTHPALTAPPCAPGSGPCAWSVRPTAQTAKRDKELADRRAYLQNFWYAAALSDKVTSTPLKVDILSRTVTVWRGEDGKVWRAVSS